MIKVVVIDALTKTVVSHEEENEAQEFPEQHCLKCCGISDGQWQYQNEIESPRGNLITKIGVSEYKQIYLTILKNGKSET